MNKAEMSKDKIISLCNCRDCPSYIECGEKAGYCSKEVGKSKCIESENGCICPTCPVEMEMEWFDVYYCTRGSEEEHRRK